MSSTLSNATIIDNAMALVRELHNNPDIIPPFNEELLKKCAQQINELYNQNLNLSYKKFFFFKIFINFYLKKQKYTKLFLFF